MKKISVVDLIAFEKKIIQHYKNNRLPFLFHLSGGNENHLIKIFENIDSNDYVISGHRNHYHAILHGLNPLEVEEKILNGRSMFIYDRKRNFFTSAIIGGTPGIAVGIALALKRKESTKKVWCFVGDGTEDTGHFAEAVRYVDGWDLPCTFIIEDNNKSVLTNKSQRWGKAISPNWPKSCVIKYKYKISFPHARIDEFCDLNETSKILKKDSEYFPHLKEEQFPDFDNVDAIGLSYKDAVTNSMTELGKENVIFLGYNIGGKCGNAMGTLKGVDNNKKIETPVTENLMASLALGMSFENIKPLVYFEKHDFILIAADAICNHINYVERLSHGEYKAPLIIRTVVNDKGLFYSGPTHSQDFTNVFKEILNFPIFEPRTPKEVLQSYKKAQYAKGPVMIVERKSYYNTMA